MKVCIHESLSAKLDLLKADRQSLIHPETFFRAHFSTTVKSGYVRRGVGNCDGFSYIETAEQCAAAAEVLGLSDVTPGNASAADNPYGCYWRGTSSVGSKLWFNSNGDRNDDDMGRVSLCSSKPLFNPDPTCAVLPPGVYSNSCANSCGPGRWSFLNPMRARLKTPPNQVTPPSKSAVFFTKKKWYKH